MQRLDELAVIAAAHYAAVDQPAARELGSNYGGSNEIQRDIMARLVLGL